ncbi:MAG: hypothetical protein M3N52_11825 [Actinomycetota bacterium]|nr:hypothetical protein [Actinomycetota bacterium]
MDLASDGSGTPDLSQFGQYGVLGVFAGLLVWFAILVWRRETTRSDRLEQENRALHAAMQDKVIPALLAAANAITECTQLLRDLQRDRERQFAHMRGNGDHR